MNGTFLAVQICGACKQQLMCLNWTSVAAQGMLYDSREQGLSKHLTIVHHHSFLHDCPNWCRVLLWSRSVELGRQASFASTRLCANNVLGILGPDVPESSSKEV